MPAVVEAEAAQLQIVPMQMIQEQFQIAEEEAVVADKVGMAAGLHLAALQMLLPMLQLVAQVDIVGAKVATV